MTTPSPSPRDVRMRGFAQRSTVAACWAWIDTHALPLDSEQVPLDEAALRVLAADILATRDVPPFDRSAMDGYALRAAETIGSSDYNPLPLQLLGESLPGHPYPGTVQPGTCVRIMTGAPLPTGADAVVPAEFAQELPSENTTSPQGQVQVFATVPPGKNIGPIGEDIKTGTLVARRQRRLRPQDLGVLASIGLADVPVVRRPRVRLIITGNELVPPGTPPGPHQIVDANSSMLRALIQRDGGHLEQQHRLPDDRHLIRQTLAAPGADVILLSGGSSVGAEDHAPSLVAEVGELAIHGIAMRPSSPAGIGRIGQTLVFLLPGNPVSCLCAYDFFAGRAIRLLGNRSPDWPYLTRQAPLARKVVSAIGRVDYTRVQLLDNGQVEPLATSGASILTSTTRADGFILIPAEQEGYPPGTQVTVYLYDPLC